MNRFTFFTFMVVQLALLNNTQSIFPKNKEKVVTKQKIPAEIKDTHTQSIMDINNITSWVRDDGYHDYIIVHKWNISTG